MSFDDLTDDLKKKLLSELDDTSGNDEKLLVIEQQNAFVESFIRRNKIDIGFDGGIKWREFPGITKEVFITKIQQSYRLHAAKFKIASPDRLGRGDLLNQFAEVIYDHKLRSFIG